MGTASTMTSMTEALGLALPGSTSIPAMDSAHSRMATTCGERIVQMIWDDLTPRRILTRGSFMNAVAVQMALGGSTNAAVHIIALARRAGVEVSLDDLDAVSRRIPVLANLFPSGDRLMEDFYYAGGLPALMNMIAHELSLGELTVTGRSVGDNIQGREVLDAEVIRPLSRPVSSGGTLVWQFGYFGLVVMVLCNVLHLYLLNSLLLAPSLLFKSLAFYLAGLPALMTIYAPPDILLMNVERVLLVFVLLIAVYYALQRRLAQRALWQRITYRNNSFGET